jgi:NAD(P)-dependent dehydrogenase (short-subunit alcohol dehydrogenase family)
MALPSHNQTGTERNPKMIDPDALKGQLALVTGGGRGIGYAIAGRLAAAGARVVICGRQREALDRAVHEITNAGGRGVAVPCDVSDEKQVLELFRHVDAGGVLDILVNNAGLGIFKPLVETTLADWDTVLGANLRGAFLCGREAMKRMKGRGGRIVNIGSVVSIRGYAHQGAYTASKHGLLGLTKVMALEGQNDNIIVQAVCPGGVDTELIGNARPDLDRSALMTPDEIADAVLFLLYQTGNALTDVVQLRRRASWPFPG